MFLSSFSAQDQRAFAAAKRLHAQGRVPEAGQAYYELLRRFPENPDLHEAMGKLAAMVNKFDHAEFHFRQCLKAAPERLDVLEDLGVTVDIQGRREEALEIFTRVVQARPDSVQSRVRRGIALSHLRRPEEALQEFSYALSLDPKHRDAMNQRAEMLRLLGRDREAFESFRALAEAHPEDALSRFQWACALLEWGRWTEGWKEYEARRRAKQNPAFPKPIAGTPWDGSARQGLRLLLQLEQGAGDSFQFWRFVPRLLEEGMHLTIQYPPSQEPVVPLLSAQGLPVEWIRTSESLPSVHAYAPLMSLVHLRSMGQEDLWRGPYLSIPDRGLPTLPSRDPGRARARVGIAYSGSPFHWNDHYRSMELVELSPLFERFPGIEWVNLNKGRQVPDPGSIRGLWTDPMPEVQNYLDTAGIVNAMDAVVSVDTGVAHLAGALDRPVLLMLPRASEWRWMRDRSDTPWYPRHTLFRQETSGDWGTVLAQVGDHLASMFPEAAS